MGTASVSYIIKIMAIADLNKKYYKINIDKCYVNNYINVAFDIYESKESRDHEKAIAEQLDKFYDYLINEANILNDIISSKNIADESKWTEIYNTDFDFKSLVDKLTSIEWLIENFNLIFYKINERHINYILPDWCLDYGIEQSWIDNPISYEVGGITNCGSYMGEEINYKLYYEALKKIIKSNTVDLL